MQIRNSAKAIIIRDGYLLVTRNRGDEGYFYLLPGGGQEHGESLTDCLRRECQEEIGTDVQVGALRFVRDYIGRNHDRAAQEMDVHTLDLMFECRLLGEPSDAGTLPDDFQDGLDWLPLDRIEEYRLRPYALRRHIRAMGELKTPVYVGDIN